MRLFGLIGQPLTHSFSAQYFKKKFEQEKIQDCQYQLFPLSTIDELPALLQQYPHLEGLNVTLPYKQQIISFLSKHFIPTGLTACNCIRIRGGSCEGYNTDWVGFEQSFLPLVDAKQQAALVLGQGGAAQAVFYVLKKNGIPYTVVGRSKKPGIDCTFAELTADQLRTHTIVINTTPLGTFPSIHEKPPLPYEAVGAGHLFFDLVYNPSQTAFIQEGIQRGARVKNGMAMLELQAEESWRIWNQ
jgi:shikimate dehydrogenase